MVQKVCVFVFEDWLRWKKGKLKEHAKFSLAFSSLFPPSNAPFLISPSQGGRSQSFSGMLISPGLCPLGNVGKGLDPSSCIPGAYQLTKLAWDNALLLAPFAAFFPSLPFCFLHPWLIWDRSFIRSGKTSIILLSNLGLWQNLVFSPCPHHSHSCPETDEISFANRLLGSSASQTFVGIFHNVG